MNRDYDVCIIGGGVTGCAIARELTRHDLKIAILEKQSDVAEGTTKANSAIVHSGYDAKPGSLKAKYNVAGSKVFEQWCQELDVAYKRNGSLVLAFSTEDLPALEALMERGITNGVSDLSILDREQLQAREPSVSPEAVYALSADAGAICSPYDLTIRLAEHAIVNGAELFTDCKVSSVVNEEAGFSLQTEQGSFSCKILVNAAGVYADEINNQISEDKFKIIPRRGQYWMLDKACGPVFSSTVFQLPTKLGKGVLVTPTVEGTIILGPTAEDIVDKDDVATTAEELEKILTTASRSWPSIPRNCFITAFAGIRAHCDRDDFIVGESKDVAGYYLAAGIESPGLTAAPAIAIELAGMIAERLGASKVSDFREAPPAIVSFRESSNKERRLLISDDPAYGRLICRCEQVSEAEIRSAIRRPAGARTVDAVKRRTRAGMGRCQGGFCLPHVIRILAEELSLEPTEITKFGKGSRILTGWLGGDQK